jgi:hypothetical protein
MGGLVVAFGADILVSMDTFKSKSYAKCSNIISGSIKVIHAYYTRRKKSQK